MLVLEHLNILLYSNDTNARQNSNLFLINWQQTVEAWSESHSILYGEYPVEAKLIASQTLRTKILYDCYQLSKDNLLKLCESLLLFLNNENLPRSITSTIGLAICDLVIQMVESWDSPVETFVNYFKSGRLNLNVTLHLLESLPEEIVNDKVILTPELYDRIELKLRNDYNKVIDFLIYIKGDNNILSVLKIWHNWRYYSNYINYLFIDDCFKIISNLNLRNQLGDETLEIAVDCIVDALYYNNDTISSENYTLKTHEQLNNNNITNHYPNVQSTPLEVQSNSVPLGVPPDVTATSVPLAVEASSNYLSLKSIATPGDRGEGRDGSSIMGMMEDGSKDVLDLTSSGIPGSDLWELEGEVKGRGHHGEWTTSGGMSLLYNIRDRCIKLCKVEILNYMIDCYITLDIDFYMIISKLYIGLLDSMNGNLDEELLGIIIRFIELPYCLLFISTPLCNIMNPFRRDYNRLLIRDTYWNYILSINSSYIIDYKFDDETIYISQRLIYIIYDILNRNDYNINIEYICNNILELLLIIIISPLVIIKDDNNIMLEYEYYINNIFELFDEIIKKKSYLIICEYYKKNILDLKLFNNNLYFIECGINIFSLLFNKIRIKKNDYIINTIINILLTLIINILKLNDVNEYKYIMIISIRFINNIKHALILNDYNNLMMMLELLCGKLGGGGWGDNVSPKEELSTNEMRRDLPNEVRKEEFSTSEARKFPNEVKEVSPNEMMEISPNAVREENSSINEENSTIDVGREIPNKVRNYSNEQCQVMSNDEQRLYDEGVDATSTLQSEIINTMLSICYHLRIENYNDNEKNNILLLLLKILKKSNESLLILDGIGIVINRLDDILLINIVNNIIQPWIIDLNVPNINTLNKFITLLRNLKNRESLNIILSNIIPKLLKLLSNVYNDNELVESICRCIKHFARCINIHFINYIPIFFNIIINNINKKLFGTYLYVVDWIYLLYDITPDIENLYFILTNLTIDTLHKTISNSNDIQELIDDFFGLQTQFIDTKIISNNPNLLESIIHLSNKFFFVNKPQCIFSFWQNLIRITKDDIQIKNITLKHLNNTLESIFKLLASGCCKSTKYYIDDLITIIVDEFKHDIIPLLNNAIKHIPQQIVNNNTVNSLVSKNNLNTINHIYKASLQIIMRNRSLNI